MVRIPNPWISDWLGESHCKRQGTGLLRGQLNFNYSDGNRKLREARTGRSGFIPQGTRDRMFLYNGLHLCNF